MTAWRIGALHTPEGAMRDIAALWRSVGGRPWTSVVLLPADSHSASPWVAVSLAHAAKRFGGEEVAAITMTQLDSGTVRALADLQKSAAGERGPTRPVAPLGAGGVDVHVPIDVVSTGKDIEPLLADGTPYGPFGVPPGARLVIGIPPILEEPLGGMVVRHADAVVLCIRMGRTTLADARGTLDLIGSDRVIGCFDVTPT